MGLAMKERLAKLESSFPKPQTRTLQSKLDGEALFNHDDRALFDKLRKADEEIQAAHGEDLVDSEGRALLFCEEERERLQASVHKTITEINDESKAAVVAGAVTDNKDMMKAGVAATAISGSAKIATRPALGSPLGRAVRKGKRKLRRGIRRALRG